MNYIRITKKILIKNIFAALCPVSKVLPKRNG